MPAWVEVRKGTSEILQISDVAFNAGSRMAPDGEVIEVPEHPGGYVILDRKKRVLVVDDERNADAKREMLEDKRGAHEAAIEEIDKALAELG